MLSCIPVTAQCWTCRLICPPFTLKFWKNVSLGAAADFDGAERVATYPNFAKKEKKNYGYMYVIRCNMYFVINSFTWNYLGNQRSKLEVLTSSGLSEVWTAFLCEYTSSILQELVSFSGNTCCIGRRVAQAGSYVHMYVFLWGGFPGFGLKSNLTLYDLLPPHHDCALTSHFHSRDLYHCIPC